MTRIDDDSELCVGFSLINPQLAVIIRKMAEIKPNERYTDDRELLSDPKNVRLTARNSSTRPARLVCCLIQN